MKKKKNSQKKIFKKTKEKFKWNIHLLENNDRLYNIIIISLCVLEALMIGYLIVNFNEVKAIYG